MIGANGADREDRSNATDTTDRARREWVRVAVTFLVCMGTGGASALVVQRWIGVEGTYVLYSLLTVLGALAYAECRQKYVK